MLYITLFSFRIHFVYLLLNIKCKRTTVHSVPLLSTFVYYTLVISFPFLFSQNLSTRVTETTTDPGSSCLRTCATLCRTSAAMCSNWRCAASSSWATSAHLACCKPARMAWLRNVEGKNVELTYHSWQLNFFRQLYLLWADASVPQMWCQLVVLLTHNWVRWLGIYMVVTGVGW